jgi:hypothetical protein
VDTIEIEPAMVEGAHLFRPAVAAAFDDRRSRIVIDDAKSFFARGGRKYDIIVSEPSNPWVSGVSSLFTQEFYARLATYLNDGGVLAQWLHTYEMDAPTLASIIAAAAKTFPEFVIYTSVDSDVILIARKGGAPGTFDDNVLALPELQPLLARLRMREPELVRRRAMGTSVALAPFLETFGMLLNSDYFPVVDQRASRTRFTKTQVRELNELQAASVPMLEMFGAAPVPAKARYQAPGVTFVDLATEDAWILRDAMMGARTAPVTGPMTKQLLAAHMLHEWAACRTGIGFGSFVQSIPDISEVVNPRLHSTVAAEVWRSLAASPCGKSLAPEERRWLALLEAIGRRDARAMTDAALPILAARPEKGPATEMALFAAVTGLICTGQPERARTLLQHGARELLQPGTRQSEVRLLDAMSSRPPRCSAPAG